MATQELELFTAADVVFSFDAVYDERVGSILADSLQTGGKKLKVVAQDQRTVVVTFAAPSRWRSIAKRSQTRYSSAPACRCTARRPKPTRSGTGRA